ncbi:response regulator transcription factor [Hahella sp. SMD15-11]|uniref:Response regulator transcription factor n=1 Tax=Thermohahella caldifontis TaxID=3142973 RepID=A0AB39UUR1_9GAMM
MTESRKTLLVVDDDLEIRELLGDYLRRNGFDTLLAEDGEAMQALLARHEPDLIVLDIMLPGEDGFSLCQKIRRYSDVPVLMLTANADDTDRIVGLELGADDYVAKPFNPRELLARIRAILRRTGREDTGDRQDKPVRAWHFAGWTLDLTRRALRDADGREEDLTGADFRLLCLLLERAGQEVSRDDISMRLSGRPCQPLDRSIDVHMSRLRSRLGDDARCPHIIKTVRGKGYVLAVPVETEHA